MILKPHSSVCVQDLRDRLWDICDARKEEAEQERLAIINESWLQDSMGIAMNHFFSLMQVRAAGQDDTDSSLHGHVRPVTTPLGMRGACFTHSTLPSLSSNLPRRLAEISHSVPGQANTRTGSISSYNSPAVSRWPRAVEGTAEMVSVLGRYHASLSQWTPKVSPGKQSCHKSVGWVTLSEHLIPEKRLCPDWKNRPFIGTIRLIYFCSPLK